MTGQEIDYFVFIDKTFLPICDTLGQFAILPTE